MLDVRNRDESARGGRCQNPVIAARAAFVGCLVATCLPLTGCYLTNDFAGAVRDCVGSNRFVVANSAAQLTFAQDDARRGRVSVVSGAGQMKSGDETDWRYAVPSQRAPQYVIVALKNTTVVTPENDQQDRELPACRRAS
jgi:hypothetical protein